MSHIIADQLDATVMLGMHLLLQDLSQFALLCPFHHALTVSILWTHHTLVADTSYHRVLAWHLYKTASVSAMSVC